jgi:thiamine pyrophosphate-dependent acetolactate synthase large subunit-like protein
VVTTFGGRGLLPPDHPCLVPGPPHVPAVGRLWDEADLVVSLGSDLDGTNTQNWAMPRPPALLAVNVDPADAAKNYPADVVVTGDVSAVLAALLDGLPERDGLAARAVVLVGDGGFLFACGELATLAQEQLPVTTVLVDDGGYGMLRFDQVHAGVPTRGVDLVTPDFVALARSFGVAARAVDGFGEEFAAALEESVDASGPDVLVVRAALTPPPSTSPRWYRRRQVAP